MSERISEIEARLAADESAFKEPGYIGDDQCMADRRHLLAELRKRDDAIDAVRKIVDDKYRIWAAVCGNTCSKDLMGVDHDAIADEINAVIHEAIRAALEPSPW